MAIDRIDRAVVTPDAAPTVIALITLTVVELIVIRARSASSGQSPVAV